MKRILITGADSYIGTSFEKWVKQPQFAGMYEVDTLDMRGDAWKEKDFSGYDSVFHVAGIAHIKETKENAHLYYEINRDLAINTARKAYRDGVRQFVFLSSMSIYGMLEGTIDAETIPEPKSHYGKSKLQAEMHIEKLSRPDFAVAVLRPPMIYGKGCKGNYTKLSRIARISPVFPYTKSRRSMLHIDNLCEFVRKIVDDEKKGIYFPQNNEYVNVGKLVKEIAQTHEKKVFLIKGVDGFLLSSRLNVIRKTLGTLVYDIGNDRCLEISFKESVRRTEEV